MGYIVEISISLSCHANFSSVKNDIENIAFSHNCESVHEDYEMEGGTKIARNHCILTVYFEEDEIMNCAKFIGKIKRLKETHIESVCEADFKLIYASRYYLSTMDKRCIEKYKKLRRDRSYTDGELILLKQLEKYKDKAENKK
jgi:hypothetical protein